MGVGVGTVRVVEVGTVRVAEVGRGRVVRVGVTVEGGTRGARAEEDPFVGMMYAVLSDAIESGLTGAGMACLGWSILTILRVLEVLSLIAVASSLCAACRMMEGAIGEGAGRIVRLFSVLIVSTLPHAELLVLLLTAISLLLLLELLLLLLALLLLLVASGRGRAGVGGRCKDSARAMAVQQASLSSNKSSSC